MEKLREKVKRIKENDIIRSFFIIIYAIVCLLLFINQYNIQYFANGFSAIDDKKLQVYYFDVGQATATMVVLPNDLTMVIDTGSSDSEKDFMESVNLVLEQNRRCSSWAARTRGSATNRSLPRSSVRASSTRCCAARTPFAT